MLFWICLRRGNLIVVELKMILLRQKHLLHKLMNDINHKEVDLIVSISDLKLRKNESLQTLN
jgi:hypothetical protein